MASDPSELRVQAIIDAVSNCANPISKTDLRKRVGSKGFDAALVDAVGKGAIFEHPAGNGRKFSSEPWRPETQIVELCGKNPLTLIELGRKITALTRDKLHEAVRGLITDGKLAPTHRFSGNRLKRGIRFGTHEVCRKVLERTIAELTAYYLAVGVKHNMPHPAEAKGASLSNTASDEETVTARLRSLETREAVAVVVGDLRRKAGLPKERFDEAVLGLSRKGLIVLHEHDAPTLMSEDRRNDLVVDREGRYYVGISWTHSS